MLSALALLALAAEEPKFVCPTELPRRATRAKLRSNEILAADYPYIHHQNLDETVIACVEVGIDGRVKSCTAHGAKDPRVNAQTCYVFARRFRYDPAKDLKKRPINSFVIQKITWKIPE
jgi:hypothetical protein